jgi:hypothetical protein
VNIIVVIHPEKSQDDIPLGLSSIGATAKATQEADLVLMLQVRQFSCISFPFQCPSNSYTKFYRNINIENSSMCSRIDTMEI